MTRTAGKNGATVAEKAGTPKRKQIPSGIRSKLNEAFDQWGAWEGNKIGADEQEAFAERVVAAKKDVFSYINGLLKNQKEEVTS